MGARQLMPIPLMVAVGATAIVAGQVWLPDRDPSLASTGLETCTLDLTVRPNHPHGEPVPITMFIETEAAGCNIPSSFATVVRDSDGTELAAMTAIAGCQVPGCGEVGPNEVYTHIEWWSQEGGDDVGLNGRQVEPGIYTAEMRWVVEGSEQRSQRAVFEIDAEPKSEAPPPYEVETPHG